ncbi:adenine phosphoribosyltransferase [Marilutibacter maris]|uniref:Adenine phosphoribosyltransferase n=1 Tax=Marilutibacter maris TaxID=1605891 RepID=A0A2U9T6D6_9GAMM|nr:adenine phosphoribosyltransferase [Lysobacter maris]AWV08111.1 adenine phosphoribosyltransferase [Lysobacter maris]
MPPADDAGRPASTPVAAPVDELDVDALRAWILDVPNFPSAGVLFRDVTPMLADAEAFGRCIDALAAPWQDAGVEAVCGIESRGFIFGAALARRLEVGFVPLRKPGKLPPPLVEVEYALEYGRDRLQARSGILDGGLRTLIVDDVLATGGTLAAAHELVTRLGGLTVGAGVVIELSALGGRARWPRELPLRALLDY